MFYMEYDAFFLARVFKGDPQKIQCECQEYILTAYGVYDIYWGNFDLQCDMLYAWLVQYILTYLI